MGTHQIDATRERGHHQSHGSATALLGNHVTHNRKNQRAGDAAKGARHHPGRHQQMITGSEGTSERADGESQVQHEHGPLAAIEQIKKETRGDSRNSGADRVRRYDQTELAGRNSKYPHVLRPQRHYDQEIDDGRELDRG